MMNWWYDDYDEFIGANIYIDTAMLIINFYFHYLKVVLPTVILRIIAKNNLKMV